MADEDTLRLMESILGFDSEEYSSPDSGTVDLEKTQLKSKGSQVKTIRKSHWKSDAECDETNPEEAGSVKSLEDADFYRPKPGLDLDKGVGQSEYLSEEKHFLPRQLTGPISVLEATWVKENEALFFPWTSIDDSSCFSRLTDAISVLAKETAALRSGFTSVKDSSHSCLKHLTDIISFLAQENEALCFPSTSIDDSSCLSRLTNAISVLAKGPYPDAYGEVARLLGAKPLFQPTVRQMSNTRKTSTDSDGQLSLELRKSFSNKPSIYQRVPETLKLLPCGTETGRSLWMSYTLPTDVGLPQDTLPPKSTDLQLFFLSSGQPPFLLTLYNLNKISEVVSIPGERGTAQTEAFNVQSELTSPGTISGKSETLTKESDVNMVNHEEEVEKVKLYTLQLGKLLTSALLNFCCCDFLVLPLCLSVGEFDLPTLQKGLQQQMTSARQFYGGPLELHTSSYRELKAAATAVTGVSSVPRLMTPSVEQHPEKIQDKQLVLMDADWRAVVSLLVETLTENKVTDLTYPPEARLKTQVAVVEAAKRLSFVDRVVLFTPSSQLQDSCRKLKEEVAEDTGVDLKLRVLSPDALIEPDEVSYVIQLDCPSADYMRDKTKRVVLRVSRATPESTN